MANMTLASTHRTKARHLAVSLLGLGMPAALCDQDAMLMEVNQAAASLLGSSLSRSASLFTVAPSEKECLVLEAIWRANSAKTEGWSYRFQTKSAAGTELSLQILAIPFSTIPGGKQAWLVVFQDLTEFFFHTQQLEMYAQELAQLYQANKDHVLRLEESAKSRDHFFSLVSHELKTPLTPLMAALEMLRSPGFTQDSKEHTEALVNSTWRAAQRLERVITDILDLAVARSGALSLHIRPVNISEIIELVTEEMMPLALAKGIAIKGRTRKAAMVRGDELRLQQVVQNLLSNAIKAEPEKGTIRVSISALSGACRVKITNQRATLDESLKKTIFQPFVKSTAGGYKTGAGLGLAVVDALVKAHGGSVGVLPGRRHVTFFFTVPLWPDGGSHENPNS